jgi:hypothetical protein
MKNKLTFFLLYCLCCTISCASGVVYIGVGAASDNPSENGNVPWSLGFVSVPDAGGMSWGIDIAGEGTVLDSTYGQRSALSQAFSFNGLIGGTRVTKKAIKLTGSLLIGLIEDVKSCNGDSYLGYQCYADSAPNVDYKANLGFVGMVTFKSFSVGIRITGESSQGLIGLNF